MRFSRRCLTRGAHVILAVYIITTAIMMVSFVRKHGCNDIPQQGAVSIGTVDYSLLDFISKSRVLRSTLEGVLRRELSPVANITREILEDLTALNKVIHQMEKHVDERAFRLVLSQPIINYHNFSYIHNPIQYCSKNKVDVILIIPSAVTNFEKRMKTRTRNRDYLQSAENGVKMLFFLGSPPLGGNSVNIQHSINKEVQEFGDIVQENFEDVYANNRLKSVSMLRWVSTYCSTARFVLRTDDDVEANVSALISVMHRTSHNLDNFIIGKKRIGDPPRRDSSKYYISEKEYPYPVFPPYLLGGLIGYPVSTATLLYEAALRTQPIWLEDVFITGICAWKMHIPILDDRQFAFEHE